MDEESEKASNRENEREHALARALIKRDTLDDVTAVNRHGMYAY